MDSSHLTAAQADDLANHIGPMLGYLTRLRERMQRRGWAASDPLYVDVQATREAMHRLHLTLRELSRFMRATSQDRRPWEPGGSGREA